MSVNRLRTVGVVLGLLMSAAVAFGQSVVRTGGAGGHGGGFGKMFGLCADYLDLTDAQGTQIKAILTKEKPTMQPLMQQLVQGNQQMRRIEEASSFDETKARTLATQQSQTMTELMVQKARVKSELIQVLTPDQKTKLASFEARRRARFQEHLQSGAAVPGEAVPNQ